MLRYTVLQEKLFENEYGVLHINTHAYVYIKLYQYYSNLQMHMQGVKQNLLRQCLTITAY